MQNSPRRAREVRNPSQRWSWWKSEVGDKARFGGAIPSNRPRGSRVRNMSSQKMRPRREKNRFLKRTENRPERIFLLDLEPLIYDLVKMKK